MWTRDRGRDYARPMSQVKTLKRRRCARVIPLAAPKFDLVLRGGRVIDPARGLDGIHDVGIRDGTIGAVLRTIDASDALHSLDLAGRLVVPGLIQLVAGERLRPEFALTAGRLHRADSSLLFESVA